jgi:HD superfamily phosphodiesterase
MRAIYDRLLQLARPYLDTRNNDVHVQISSQFAYRLLEQIQADQDVVIPAIVLHDLGWKMIPEELHLTAYGPKIKNPELNRQHELESVRLAREILERVNYDLEKTSEILKIIEGHDSRKTALSINDEIVKDADKLCRYSGPGFHYDQVCFGIPIGEYAEWMTRQIERWFFTDAAKTMAYHEIGNRKAEVAGNGSKGT